MNLLTQNSKLKKTSKHFDKRVFNFGIPAYKSASGKMTCPFADTCVKFCYAKKGAYIWSNVKPAFEKRYQLTKTDLFVDAMDAEIKKKKADYVRVHDSGDYYSPTYLQKWLKIALKNPEVRFYSYTNSIQFIKELKTIPANFDFIFSDSGKQVDLINKSTDRHTKIFKNLEQLQEAKYTDASNFDLYATKWFSNTKKVGLIIH
tara:strand:- start:647 stop:1255 length:609 start_codon:yes stop_codon:yes gene_type:complete